MMSLDLPDDFEQEIQNTEIAKQEILRVTAEREKQAVYNEMLIDVEQINMEITTLGAEGQAYETTQGADINSATF